MGSHMAKLKRFARMPTASLKNVDDVLNVKSTARRHPTTVEGYNKLMKDNPAFESIVRNKDENLHKMLETVRVDSAGAAPNEILRSGKRARKIDVIPEGKLSYEQIEELFTNFKVSPEIWTKNEIAEKYKLDDHVVKNLLSYYSSFHIYKIPEKKMVTGALNKYLQKDEDNHPLS